MDRRLVLVLICFALLLISVVPVFIKSFPSADWSKPALSISIGTTASYLKVSINGVVWGEESIGFNFIAERSVNVNAGDVVEIWYSTQEGWYGYAKVKVNKIPEYYLEPVLTLLSKSGSGKPGLKEDIILIVFRNIEPNPNVCSDYFYVDIPDAPSTTTTTTTTVPATTTTKTTTTTTTVTGGTTTTITTTTEVVTTTTAVVTVTQVLEQVVQPTQPPYALILVGIVFLALLLTGRRRKSIEEGKTY